MIKKSVISKQQWTGFWKNLGIHIKKPKAILKKYKPISDIRILKKLGVDINVAQKVYKSFQAYQEPDLQFHRFIRFFRKDSATVLLWTGQKNASDTFNALFRILHFGSLTNAQRKLQHLYLLHEMNKKGVGRTYELKYQNKGSLKNLKGSKFAGILSKSDDKATYEGLGKFKIGNSVVIPLLRDTGEKSVYKFLKFAREGDKVLVSIAVDSKKELNITRYVVSEYFKSYLDIPEVNGDFESLINFLKSGTSAHYTLTGINFFDNAFKISITPQFNRIESILSSRQYMQKMQNVDRDFVQYIGDIKIANSEINTRNQIFVRFYTFITEGIIGAVMFSLDDRKLNSVEREKFQIDFVMDFKLPLNTLIRFDNQNISEIYKTFLKNIPKKRNTVHLRSDYSLKIYTKLVTLGLLTSKFETKEDAAYCFNKDCRVRYELQWNRKTCHNCGSRLFSDKQIVVSKIDEKDIATFFNNACSQLRFQVKKVERSLVNRKLFVVEVRAEGESICIIPVTKAINEHQLEVIRLRYPNAVLITSKDDVQLLAESGLEVLELYEITQKLLDEDLEYIKNLIKKVTIGQLGFIRKVSAISASRLNNINFYMDKNKIARNLGAEVYEADCSLLLQNMFGNSIWLGASKRGVAFPDGMTALPLTTSRNGCFLWDSKFCESRRIAFGSVDKNIKYIKDGKSNVTIIDNGRLKGFLFISNSNSFGTFEKKFKKLTKGRNLKVTFMNGDVLLKIYNHFHLYENKIRSNSEINETFIQGIKELLFKIQNKQKVFILDEKSVEFVLNKSEEIYKTLETQPLSPV